MTIANYFTFFRIFVSPIFLFIYIAGDSIGIGPKALPYVLLSLLALSEFSDVIDGYLARRLNQVTDFGKLIDPMADSIYHISVFLTFTLEPINVPMIFIFMFIYRDSVISTLRTICALKGFALAARMSGKIKSLLQGVAAFTILILMIPHSLGKLSPHSLETWSFWIVGVVAFYAFFSAIDYILANRYYIARILTTRTE